MQTATSAKPLSPNCAELNTLAPGCPLLVRLDLVRGFLPFGDERFEARPALIEHAHHANAFFGALEIRQLRFVARDLGLGPGDLFFKRFRALLKLTKLDRVQPLRATGAGGVSV